MSRVLFVVPPLRGHVNPTLALAAELRARGHEVAWTGLAGAVEPLLPPGSTFLPATGPIGDDYDDLGGRGHQVRGPAALKFLWEEVLFPLARAMLPGVEAVVEQWQPDVVVADQQALAGAVVGYRRGIRWVTSATTSAEFARPLDALPKVKEWMDSQLLQLQLEAGIAPAAAAGNDLMASPHLVLAYTTVELVGADDVPAQVRFVGPSIARRPEALDGFPWEWLRDDVPHLLVSLGTLNAEAGERFWAAAAEAVRGLDVQAVFVAPPALVPDPPANVLVREHVPQLALLERMDAVVSHAGHNTVCESLAAGLPMVLAPIRDDQPIVADQVVRAGAGVRVTFGRVRPDSLRAAMQQTLEDPALRAGAALIQASFAAAGGASAAADAVLELARQESPLERQETR